MVRLEISEDKSTMQMFKNIAFHLQQWQREPRTQNCNKDASTLLYA